MSTSISEEEITSLVNNQSVFKEKSLELSTYIDLCNLIRNNTENRSPKDYLISTFIPKFTLKVLKLKISDEVLSEAIIEYIKCVLDICLKHYRSSSRYLQLLKSIFELESKFYQSKFNLSLIKEDSYANLPISLYQQKNQGYYTIIDYWGRINGFKEMINQMLDVNTPLSHYACFLSIIKEIRFNQYFNEVKYDKMVSTIITDVLNCLKCIPIDHLKESSKDELEEIILDLTFITQKSLLDSKMIHEIIESLSLDFAIKCLQLDMLEKKYHAILHINSFIKGMESPLSSFPRATTKQFLVSWILDNELIEKIFQESKHIQLIKNSKPIVKYILQYDKLKLDLFKVIWECAINSYESLSQETLSLISSIASHLNEEQVEFIIKELGSLDIEIFTSSILHFIFEVCNKLEKYRYKFISILWKILLTDEKEIISQLVFKTLNSITEMPYFIKMRDSILFRSIDDLKESSFQEKKLYLYNIITLSLKSYVKTRDYHKLSYVLDKLEEDMSFHIYILDDLKNFKDICKNKLKLLKMNDINKYLKYNPFPNNTNYNDEIRSRLNLLQVIFSSCDIIIDEKDVLEKIWIMTYDESISIEERYECLNWFLNIQYRNQNSHSSFSNNVTPFVFDMIIKKIDFESMDPLSFSCFNKFFRDSNSFLDKIIFDGRDLTLFALLDHPQNINGEKQLWDIILNCNNNEVVESSMSLLNLLYENVSTKVLDKTELRELFFDCCLNRLASITDDEFNSVKISRLLQLMNKSLDRFDSNDNNSDISIITRGRPFELTVHLDYEEDDEPKRFTFQLETHSSSLLTTLYKEIKSKCESYLTQKGLPISLKFNNQFTRISNKTLYEVGIHDFNEVVVENRSYPKERFTNLKPRISFFNKGNDHKDVMSDSKITKVMEVTGLSRTHSIIALDKWSWDVNRVIKAMLNEETKEQFLSSNNLEEYEEDDDEIIKFNRERTEEIYSLDSSHSFLSSKRVFDQLFRIFMYKDESIIRTAWNMINSRLPISNELKQSLLTMKNGCIDDILTNETYRLLYVLNIINKILFPLDRGYFNDKINKWRDNFISMNGHVRLISLLLKYTSSNQNDKNIDDIIHFILKIIDNLSEHDENLLRNNSDDLIKVINNLFSHFTSTSHMDLIFYLFRIINGLLKNNISLVSILPSFNDGITNLLISNSSKDIRMTTSHQLYRVILNSETFLFDVYKHLNELRRSYNKLNDKYYDYFFWIFNKVLNHILESSKYDSLDVNLNNLKMEMIQLIHNDDLYEQNSQNINWILCGSIQILTTIINHSPDKDIQYNDLIDFIFYDLLFKEKKYRSDRAHKCKSKISRESSFKLLQSISQLNKSNFDYIILHFKNLLSKVDLKNIGWRYDPETVIKSSTGYVGLDNNGSKGYINSILQQLFMTPFIVERILSIQPDESNLQIIEPLQYILGYLYESEKVSYHSSDFYYNVFELEGNLTTRYQDPADFFTFLCNRIKEEVKDTEKESIFNDIYITKVSSIIKSIDDNFPYISETEEELYTIPLNVKRNNNLESAIDFFTQKESLVGDNQFYCDQYKSRINATKQYLFSSLPNTIVFQLMRFEYDLDTGNRNKLNYYFEFPMRIDMKRWMKDNNEDDSFIYSLVGILVHDEEKSHYYSIIKERNPPYRFIQFNDNKIEEFNIDKISEYYGGMKTKSVWNSWESKFIEREVFIEKNAYILFYERIEDNSEVKLRNDLKLPSNISDQIWRENTMILNHLNVFSKDFFEFLKNLLSSINHIEPNEDSYRNILNLVTRIIFEIIARSKNNDCIYRMISYLKKYYRNSLQSCLDFVEYVGEGYIIKKLLIECPNEYIRIEFCDFLLTVLSVLSKNNSVYHSNEKTLSNNEHFAENALIKVIYDLLEDTRSHWKQFKQYFQVIKGYISFGSKQRLYMLELGVIKEYVDYFIGKPYVFGKRDSINDSENYADLTEFYDIISILIRGSNIHHNKTPPPNKIDAELIDVPDKYFEPLWNKNFFNEFIKLDINTKAVIDIIKYISFNSIENTDFVMRLLLSNFSDNNRNISETLFEEMILMEDDEESIQSRINNYIISYRLNPSSKCESLLKVAKTKYNTIPVLNYILRLAHKSKPLVDILSSSSHIYWIIDKYETSLQKKYDDFVPDADIINNDLENGYHLLLFSNNLPDNINEDWRLEKDYFGFLFSHFIAKQSNSPVYYDLLTMYQSRQSDNLKYELSQINEKRKGLGDKINKLKDQASLMIKLIKKYKNNHTGDVPIRIKSLYDKIDHSLEDENTNLDDLENHSIEMNDEELEENSDQNGEWDIFNPGIITVDDFNSYTPINPEENHNEKLETLKAFFSNIDDDILLSVLKDNNYDVELAANDIMDEETMKKYTIKHL